MRVHYLPVIAAGLGLALSTSVANADVFNKKTKLTFSQPVRVPGKTLSAGSYFFKLVDSQSNRNIIQITNVREDRVYATILALPDYRLNPNSHTVVTFGETGAGCASAVKAWFYPGDNAGNRFVYGKKEAAEMAKSCQQPVPSVPTEVATKAVTAPAGEGIQFDRARCSRLGAGPCKNRNGSSPNCRLRAVHLRKAGFV